MSLLFHCSMRCEGALSGLPPPGSGPEPGERQAIWEAHRKKTEAVILRERHNSYNHLTVGKLPEASALRSLTLFLSSFRQCFLRDVP